VDTSQYAGKEVEGDRPDSEPVGDTHPARHPLLALPPSLLHIVPSSSCCVLHASGTRSCPLAALLPCAIDPSVMVHYCHHSLTIRYSILHHRHPSLGPHARPTGVRWFRDQNEKSPPGREAKDEEHEKIGQTR
jgi:hypothetical protein